MHKLKKNVAPTNFSASFIKIVFHFKRFLLHYSGGLHAWWSIR